MTGSILEAQGVTYSYGGAKDRTTALHKVSVGVRAGSRTALLGANGAGKSTLFYHFNGVFKPKSGTVLHKGEPLDYSREALSELRSEVCVVVQNPDEQIFSSTVEEDIAFGPLNAGMPRDEVEARIEDALFKVGMEAYRTRPSTQLSYGQRKRVSIAGALAVDPEVLILDEPTAGLDPQMSQEVIEIVDQLCEGGTTVVVSTHDVDLAYSWAEDAAVLRRGRAVFSGTPEGFFSDVPLSYSCGLGTPSVAALDASLRPGLPGSPRTRAELLFGLAPEGAEIGRVEMVPVRQGDDVSGEASAVPADVRVGVYGSVARRAFAASGARADHRFDAIDGCAVEAVRGADSVLFCDEGMVGFARRRLSALERFGRGSVL